MSTLFLSGCERDSNTHGSLIATIITPQKIYLCSDGRVVHRPDNSITNNFSKVHRINDFTGMLTAGEYMPHLEEDVISNCNRLGAKYVDDVAKIVSQVVKKYLELDKAMLEDSLKIYHLTSYRCFVFVAGYDINSKPRLFFLDTNTNFEVNERLLFQNGANIEIAVNPLPEDVKGDANRIITDYLTARNSDINPSNVDEIIKGAFDSAKTKIGSTGYSIGGDTFFSIISLQSGYQRIY